MVWSLIACSWCMGCLIKKKGKKNSQDIALAVARGKKDGKLA